MNENNYSRELAKLISEYLKKNDWSFNFDEEAGVFTFGLRLTGKLRNTNYRIWVRDDHFSLYANSPIYGDPKNPCQMATLSEFISRANYGLTNGNFEFDFRDGEIRYKIYINADGISPSEAIIESSIYVPAAMLNRYGAGIVGIVYGDLNAEDAVKMCEKED